MEDSPFRQLFLERGELLLAHFAGLGRPGTEQAVSAAIPPGVPPAFHRPEADTQVFGNRCVALTAFERISSQQADPLPCHLFMRPEPAPLRIPHVTGLPPN